MKSGAVLTVTGILLLTTGTVYANLKDGLVAYYPFSGNANDVSGNGNHGTVCGAIPIADRLGNADSAYYFNGVDAFIDLPDGFGAFTNGVTISMWVNTLSTSGRWPHFIDLDNGCDADNIAMGRVDYTRTLCFTVHLVYSGGYIFADDAIELDRWQHFVAVEDNSGNVKLYADGLQIASGTTAVPANVLRTSNFIAKSNWQGACFTIDAFFHGDIDEVRIYNRALSEKEVKALSGDTVALTQDLAQTIIDLNLQNGIENSLDAKLDAVIKVLDDLNANNDVSAVNKLESFISEVKAQSDRTIPAEDADDLTAAAQQIIDLLTNG